MPQSWRGPDGRYRKREPEPPPGPWPPSTGDLIADWALIGVALVVAALMVAFVMTLFQAS